MARRYNLPTWSSDDYLLHKRADSTAAASEALHVAGWSAQEIRDTLEIRLAPLIIDPLPQLHGLCPWEPWPARQAAAIFLSKLRELSQATYLDAPADLAAAIERETRLASLKSAFSRLPDRTRHRCARPVTGNSLTDTFVFVEAQSIAQEHLEGVIVDGERDENGEWVLDSTFTVFTAEEELIRVSGWGCHVEIL